jgi:hypothetical protein
VNESRNGIFYIADYPSQESILADLS